MFGLFRKNVRQTPAPHKGLRPEPHPPAVPPRHGGQGQTYTKVFHWRLPGGQVEEPRSVEIVGSFTHWKPVPLHRDGKLDSWHAIIHHIPGNRTHHYMLLVDGKPAWDKNSDGVTPGRGPEEERFQIMTDKGPRVFVLFAQAK